MKYEPYLSMDPVPGEAPTFNIVISGDEMSVDLYEFSKGEIREFIKDIEDQLTLHLSVNEKLQSSMGKTKPVDKQYSLGDYLMREESLPCLHCGSDETETRGHHDDGVAVSVMFWCYDCQEESTHIMGMEPQYWAKVKKVHLSTQTARKET